MSRQTLPAVTRLRFPLFAALLGLCLLWTVTGLTGMAAADDDGGSGNSGHGSENSGPGGGDDGDDGDNSGPGGHSGPGSGGGDDDEGAEEGEHGASAGGTDDREDHHVRGQIIVANVDEAGRDTIRSLGFRILEETRLEALGITILRLATPRGWAESRARDQVAAALPGVIVDLNSLYAMQGNATLPQRDYGRAMVGWTERDSGCGRGMRIGMVDTAVDESLPAFAGARIAQARLVSDADPAPHGTAVAAILVAQPGRSPVPGLVPEAELQVAGVFARSAAGGLSADAVAIAGALNWLAQRRADVVNMSLAGDPNDLVALAIRRMSSQGTIFVAAVGNSGADTTPGFPATLPEVIAVTAIDSEGKLYKNAPSGPEIDFAAPGVRIWSPDRESQAGRFVSGTSFAAPFVTAAAALLRLNDVQGTDAIMRRLAESALDLGDSGKDSAFGWGLIKAPALCGASDGAS